MILLYNMIMNFKDWIFNKYKIWRDQNVDNSSVAGFAGYVGISQQLMSEWLNKGKPPNRHKNIEKLIAKYGVEVYDVLNLPRPDPLLTEITTNWGILTDEEKRKIQEIVDQSQPNAQRASAPGAAKTRPRNI